MMNCNLLAGPSTGLARLSWWMAAGYAYYEEDDPILTDDLYDALGAEILGEGRSAFEGHPHVDLFPWDTEGHSPSGHAIHWPARVRWALEWLRNARAFK